MRGSLSRTGELLAAALAAYLVGGLFMSRQDMAVAYLLLGWVAALQVRPLTIGATSMVRRKTSVPAQ